MDATRRFLFAFLQPPPWNGNLNLDPTLRKANHMPKAQHANSLQDHLARSNEINLTVTGRRTGRKSTRPIWFVLENGKLDLLPVSGSDTQWYQNVRVNPTMEIEAHGAKGNFRAAPITDPQEVKTVVEKFRGKYGAADVKKYYSKLDVAVEAKPA